MGQYSLRIGNNHIKCEAGQSLSNIDNLTGHLIAYGNGIYLAVQGDGTLFALGKYEPSVVTMSKDFGGRKESGSYVQGYHWDDWKPWNDLLAVYAMAGLDYGFFVGLKKNGRTVAAGYNGEGQCDDINSWYGVKSVVFFLHNAVALTYSGKLLCSGRLKNNDIWAVKERVAKICPGNRRISILKETGTVSIFEFNDESTFTREISTSLNGIADIFSYGDCTYAFHRDGRIITIGASDIDEAAIIACAGIQKIIHEYTYTVALTSQKGGSLIFAGEIPAHFEKAKEWRGLQDIVCWEGTLIGVTSKGELYVTDREDEFLDGTIPAWKKEWGEAVKGWEGSLMRKGDAISSICECGPFLIAVTTAGRLLFSGDPTSLSARKFARAGIITYSKDRYQAICAQAEAAAEEEATRVNREWKMTEYRRKKVCQHCGGKFAGLVIKTCQVCGKRKDY